MPNVTGTSLIGPGRPNKNVLETKVLHPWLLISLSLSEKLPSQPAIILNHYTPTRETFPWRGDGGPFLLGLQD